MISDEVKAIRAALYAAYNDDRSAHQVGGPAGFTEQAEALVAQLYKIAKRRQELIINTQIESWRINLDRL